MQDFLKLRCCDDILKALHPINQLEKEVTEAMALIKVLRTIVLREPNKYTLFDICAGNGLVGALGAFMMPLHATTCLDLKPRIRRWDLINHFSYIEGNIKRIDYNSFFPENTILIAAHPCKIARNMVDIYNECDKIKHLIIMPCCEGNLKLNASSFIKKDIGSYLAWTLDLAIACGGSIKRDEFCISPKNLIIKASKS